MKSHFRNRAGNGTTRQARSAATRSSNPAEAPDRNTPIKLSHEDIFKKACSFEDFASPSFAPGVTVRNGLANMEDLVAYSVSEPVQKQLWKEEIKRIATAVENFNDPIEFAGSDEFNLDSKEAHQSLAALADKLLVSLNIVISDNHSALMKHNPDAVIDRELAERSRHQLGRFVADPSAEDESDTESLGANIDALIINHKDYFELVDYVSAMVARVLCRAASGKFWHDTMLAKSAKIAAKLKVMSGNLKQHAETSLENSPPENRTRNVGLGNIGGRNANYGEDSRGQNILENLEGMLGMMDRKENQPSFAGPNTAQKALTRSYYLNESVVQHSIFRIYLYVLVSLRGSNGLRTALSTSYEICAMLYNTGYGNFPVFLFQDIDGEYLGTSSDEHINVSHASFQVVNVAVEGLVARHQSRGIPRRGIQSDNTRVGRSISGRSHPPAESQTRQPSSFIDPEVDNTYPPHPPSPNNPKSVGTAISWFYTENLMPIDTGPKRIDLQTMSDVITVMVPLALASPIVVRKVTKFFEVFAFLEGSLNLENQPVLYRPTEFKASFCLTTAEYLKVWDDQPKRGSVSQLSKSLVARDTLLSWHPGRQIHRRARTADMGIPMSTSFEEERKRELREEQEDIRHSLKEFERTSRRMKDWVFEENGVRVRCDWYVGAVSAAATVLVLGGMAAGITIGERLPGVDPFNITTFSWVLAAFIILIAKSVRVASWPWWDFLHRQVLCRSVSELSAVTGIEDQLILAYLLQEESKTPVQTRGPYNTVFSCKASGGDGFSIDQPMHIRTMLLSGLIMIQVQAIHHGKFLVCLDLRRGTDYNVILQTRESLVSEGEYIVSERLADEPSEGTTHRIILKKETPRSWSRAIGVFSQKNFVFC
ncbi:hypothetical protein CFIO01_07989 [Colletotrichum fioriniae PJ7]|uniref:Uncharacterized protein n=1 Tax=Colletotrichum fioriniae PJ7 TaxID=1445577 RepID=A0A010REB3_9PEZI|nr:hypothetical protein CFIO01_07989 [Colletotrichum fioriniae PJ7]